MIFTLLQCCPSCRSPFLGLGHHCCSKIQETPCSQVVNHYGLAKAEWSDDGPRPRWGESGPAIRPCILLPVLHSPSVHVFVSMLPSHSFGPLAVLVQTPPFPLPSFVNALSCVNPPLKAQERAERKPTCVVYVRYRVVFPLAIELINAFAARLIRPCFVLSSSHGHKPGPACIHAIRGGCR